MSSIHVDCACTHPIEDENLVQASVAPFLRKNFRFLPCDKNILDIPRKSKVGVLPEVESIRVSAQSLKDDSQGRIDLEKTSYLKIHVFTLDSNKECNLNDYDGFIRSSNGANVNTAGLDSGEDDGKSLPSAKVLCLPHRSLDKSWETLIFEDHTQDDIFQYLQRRVEITLARHSSGGLSPWSRAVLLHGPPGTGKTSLCQALAQRLAIRMKNTFSSFILMKIDAQSIFSKWFSESGKAVGRLFDTIDEMLSQNPSRFVVILMDEIESLASSRESSSNGSDPKDAMRAVNALLIALDQLRQRPNALLLSTSNMVDAIDSAFCDRVDDKFYLGSPALGARYDILRREFIELLTQKVLDYYEDLGPCKKLSSINSYINFDGQVLPPFDAFEPEAAYMLLDYGEHSLSLLDLASRCEGMSGRMLRNLPEKSLSTFSNPPPYLLADALNAAKRSVSK